MELIPHCKFLGLVTCTLVMLSNVKRIFTEIYTFLLQIGNGVFIQIVFIVGNVVICQRDCAGLKFIIT